MPGGSLARLHLGAALQQVGKVRWGQAHACALIGRPMGRVGNHRRSGDATPPGHACSASGVPGFVPHLLCIPPCLPAAAGGAVFAGLLWQLHGHCRHPAGLAPAAGHKPGACLHRWVGVGRPPRVGWALWSQRFPCMHTRHHHSSIFDPYHPTGRPVQCCLRLDWHRLHRQLHLLPNSVHRPCGRAQPPQRRGSVQGADLLHCCRTSESCCSAAALLWHVAVYAHSRQPQPPLLVLPNPQ